MTDALGFRKKFGIVVPSVNTIVQPECDLMRPPGVTNHIARIATKNRPLKSDADFTAHVESMRAGIMDAVDQCMGTDPDFIIMGLSLEAFWDGVEGAKALMTRVEERAGVPGTMGSAGILAALDAYASASPIKTISLITPHRPMGDERVHAYFAEAGYTVKTLKSFDCQTPLAIGHVQPQDMLAAIEEVDGEDVDAIIQVGTNLCNALLAPAEEQKREKPVIAINTATYWHALRSAGIPDQIEGFGKLLAEW